MFSRKTTAGYICTRTVPVAPDDALEIAAAVSAARQHQRRVPR
ncbi:MAG: hypothetical protein AB1430_12520 [Pseudomonadota bacterium]